MTCSKILADDAASSSGDIVLVNDVEYAAPVTCDQLDALVGTAQNAVLAALELSADGDLDGALPRLDEAITAFDEWLALADTEDGHVCLGKAAKKLIKQYKSANKQLAKTRDLYSDMSVHQVKRLKTIQKANKIFAKGDKIRFKYAGESAPVNLEADGDPVFLLQELNARSAGFHYPDNRVCFDLQIKNPGGIIGPITAVIVNPAKNLGFIAVQPTNNITLGPTGGRFCVIMGPNMGGARVDILMKGVKVASRLLFNKGEKPTADTFDGNYAGSYGGTVVYYGDPDEVIPVNGGVTFSIAGRVMTVSSPGNGRGRIMQNGKTKFTAGAGLLLVSGRNVTYSGHLILTRSGSVKARGTWHVKFKEGKGSGGWNATR